MKGLVRGFFIVMAVLAGVPAQALEPLATYDDFSVGFINPDKWFGSESGGNGVDVVRQVVTKRLRLAYRSYADTNIDGGRRSSNLRLNFRNPSAVTAIGATVQVRKFTATHCSSSNSNTSAELRIEGFFFNAGTPTPDSTLDDVRATIRMVRSSDPNSKDPSDVLRVSAAVDYFSAAGTISLAEVELGTVTKGQAVRLRMVWDPDNDQFIFQRDDEPPVPAPYAGLSDAAPPGSVVKRFALINAVVNCTTEPRPVGSMDVFLDNVETNASAVVP